MPKFKAKYVATLPASAQLIFEAENMEAAQEYAEEHETEANWDGADYDRPEGAAIEVWEITEI